MTMSSEGLVLRGHRVLLREKRMGDAPDDFAWSRDQELAQLDATAPLRISFSDFLILYTEEMEYPNPFSRRFAIENLERKHIGNCSYYDIDFPRKEAELGIMIGDRAYWGQGYGPDVLNTLLRHLFLEAGMERLYLHTLDWNHRAQKAFTKCGFTPRERVLRNGHTFIRMEQTRRDFLARLKATEEAEPPKDKAPRPRFILET
ncbi:MAG: GNAT family N-acetyltransferase [Chloroflexi bacterium]|nr:GNAT family N-acetyltransferase [Chloroflexota bacterium]